MSSFHSIEKSKGHERKENFLARGIAHGRVSPHTGGEKRLNFQNSKDMCIGILPSQPASVCAQRMRCSRLHSLEKMLAFSRSVPNKFDTLK